MPVRARATRTKCEADINSPVGADAHGFCFSSRRCKVHAGVREAYGVPVRGLGQGIAFSAPPAPGPRPQACCRQRRRAAYTRRWRKAMLLGSIFICHTRHPRCARSRCPRALCALAETAFLDRRWCEASERWPLQSEVALYLGEQYTQVVGEDDVHVAQPTVRSAMLGSVLAVRADAMPLI